jgi:GNAT superfamily N-acetyltransferase
VVANELKQVMGYYALASGAVTHQEATRAIRQNMPDPIPVMVLGRLAVDLRAQGQKLGSAMLQDALQRCAMVSQNAGVRALLVHALNETARQFYEHYGFKALAAHPRTLMMRV